MEEIFLTNEENEERLIQIKKNAEKENLKKAVNLIGLALFLQLIIPDMLINGLVMLGATFSFTEGLLQLFADPGFLILLQTMISLFVFTLPYLIIARGLGKSAGQVASFGLPEKGTFLPLVLMGLGFCTFGNLATNTIASFFSLLGINYSSPNITYPEGLLGTILVIIAITITPALVEEFAIRGMTMGALRPYGKGFAIVVSSLVFGLMHTNFMQIPFAFIVGIALGFAAIKSGSIWTAIAIHFLNNALSVAMDYLFMVVTSPNIQSVIITCYFAATLLAFFVGIFLTTKKEGFWRKERTESLLTIREQLSCVALSPMLLIAFGVAILMSVGSIL